MSTTHTVGERLRAAREGAGLTVEQVSARTRIRVPVLHQLEQDHLGPAASAVYTRGHIRAIASAVGVDPAPLVRAFDEQIGASAPAASTPLPVPVPRQPSGGLSVPLPAPPERQTPRWLAASLAGVAVLVALLAVGVLSDDPPDSPEALQGQRAEAPATPRVTPPSPAAAAPSGAALVLRASGRSWLSVRNGSTTLFEGVVESGWTQQFADPVAVSARVGNAAAVAASCAGAPVGPPGAEGAVLSLTCTPQGLQPS